jgi:hypothetical protein
VVTEDPQHMIRAAETFQRVSSGLALDGIAVRMDFNVFEEDEDDETSGTDSDSPSDREAPEA